MKSTEADAKALVRNVCQDILGRRVTRLVACES